MREAVSSLIGQAGGVLAVGDLQVQQNATPNMSVNVTAGRAWIPNTFSSAVSTATGSFYPGGMYYTENDATVNLGVSASSTLNPRLDLVVVQVQDASYSGAANLVQPVVLTGTPTSGASLSNWVGLPSVPASSLLLAFVLVPANASTVVTGNISNVAGLVGSGVAGRELGYAQVVAPVTVTNTLTTVPGLSVPITASGRPVYVTANVPPITGSASNVTIALTEDGTTVRSNAGLSGSSYGDDVLIGMRRTPSAGAHTYAVTMQGSATLSIGASATDPFSLSVVQG